MLVLPTTSSLNPALELLPPPLPLQAAAEPKLPQENLALDTNPAAVYLAGLSKNARITMRSSLDKVAQLYTGDKTANCLIFPWASLRYQHTAAIRTILKDKYAAPSASKMLCGVRCVLKEAWRLGLINAEDYNRAVDLPGIRSVKLPRGRALSVKEMQQLVSVCKQDGSDCGLRDAAVLVMGYSTGLRRSELANLKLTDLDLQNGEVRVIAGKGNKDRTTYLPSWALPTIQAYLSVRGNEAGSFFYQSDKRGKLQSKPISDEVVLRLLKKRVAQAGLRDCSPHDLRRTFVSEMLDAGVDIATVQKMAGHADIGTTAKYDRRGELAKLKAASLLKEVS